MTPNFSTRWCSTRDLSCPLSGPISTAAGDGNTRRGTCLPTRTSSTATSSCSTCVSLPTASRIRECRCACETGATRTLPMPRTPPTKLTPHGKPTTTTRGVAMRARATTSSVPSVAATRACSWRTRTSRASLHSTLARTRTRTVEGWSVLKSVTTTLTGRPLPGWMWRTTRTRSRCAPSSKRILRTTTRFSSARLHTPTPKSTTSWPRSRNRPASMREASGQASLTELRHPSACPLGGPVRTNWATAGTGSR
mmetsp:Transcript_24487/g.27144  ORF Transcript_24487/g.27144 Transcript_24487/m.27144 type:complete len:252 (+) Transcript_24487:46-801(+)